MLLANFLSKTLKEGGIILIDSKGQKYICGNPSKETPLTLKLLKKDLKLLIKKNLLFTRNPTLFSSLKQ